MENNRKIVPLENKPAWWETDLKITEAFSIHNFYTKDITSSPSFTNFQDGHIEIEFSETPPEGLDKTLSEVLGVEVYWEDREQFLIEEPEADTMRKLLDFFLNYGVE